MSNPRPDGDYFEIKPDQLLEQWSTFARDYYHNACSLADARMEYERAKRHLAVVEAELDRDIRHAPEEFGVTKITEPVVEKTILLQKRYRKAGEELIIAKHEMDIKQAYMDAMDAMKKGLESMVYLNQSAFHAEPKARGVAGDALREQELKNLRRLGQRSRDMSLPAGSDQFSTKNMGGKK